jgi:hypothetical protein
MFTGSASLPAHLYAFVDRAFVRKGGEGFEPCVWFGLHAHPGRMWGCHVMLECGAVYRSLPPHALAFCEGPNPSWSEKDAQAWDCYGRQFSLLVYDYLYGLDAALRSGEGAHYLFTAVPVADAFSEAPEQAKEFMFLKTHGGRLTVQPTDRALFRERSFTKDTGWPKDIGRQTDWWSCED